MIGSHTCSHQSIVYVHVVHDSTMRNSSHRIRKLNFAGAAWELQGQKDMPSEAVYWKNKYNIQPPPAPPPLVSKSSALLHM